MGHGSGREEVWSHCGPSNWSSSRKERDQRRVILKIRNLGLFLPIQYFPIFFITTATTTTIKSNHFLGNLVEVLSHFFFFNHHSFFYGGREGEITQFFREFIILFYLNISEVGFSLLLLEGKVCVCSGTLV